MLPPLLYLPGLDGTGRMLNRQRRLFDDFDVRCVDFPHDRLASYEELADMGTDALVRNAAGRPAVLLAESFGGAVALTLALRRPDLIERLFLVNTFAYFPRRLWLYLANLVGGYFPNRPPHPLTRLIRRPFFFAPDVPADDRNDWWQRTAHVPLQGYALRMKIIHDLDLRPRLPEINIPALVLVATNDRIVPPPAGRDLARRLPHARLIEMPVGHAALAHPRVDVATMLRSVASDQWPVTRALPAGH